MKKLLLSFLIILFFVAVVTPLISLVALISGEEFFISVSYVTVYAEEEDKETEKNLDDAVNDTLSGLDLSGYDDLINTLSEYNDVTLSKTVRQLVNDILSGNSEINFSYFLNLASKLFLGEVTNILPQLLMIVVIALLFGVLQNLNSGFAKADTQKIVYLACYGLILTVIGYMVAKSITGALRTFEFIGKFTDVCFPVLVTLIAALGGSASAAVYQPLVLIFGTVLMKMITVVIMPLFYITFVFGLVGNLSDNLKLDKFAKTAKSVAEWIMGITFSLFITFLTAQGITGAGFDSLAAKGAKFALSSYVPIIGSYLKEGFDIVVAGCIVVKNALGLCSIFLLLAAVLAPVLKIVLLMFGFKITAAVLEPVTDAKFSSVLCTVAESMKILIVAILCAAFSALIMIMMIIYTCNFGVL